MCIVQQETVDFGCFD